MSDKRQVTFALEVQGFTPGTPHLVGFDAHEHLSEPYRVDVEAISHEPVTPEDLLHKKATLLVNATESDERRFHGVTSEVTVIPEMERLYRVRFRIVPRLATLAWGRDCCIFQEKSVKEVVEEVLKKAGLSASAFSFKLNGKYPKHANIVQYAESDYDFIRRLLFEEGIEYAFVQEIDEEKILFFDDEKAIVPIDGRSTLVERSSTQLDHDVVFDVVERRVGGPDMTMLRDYDLKRPGLDLSAKDKDSDASNREVYDHAGGFGEVAEGKQRAKRRLQRLRALTRRVEGGSDCVFLEPGKKLTIQGHPRVDVNLDLLVVSVSHLGGVDGDDQVYENSFTTIPADVLWRSQNAPPQPPTPGPQPAFVTVPAGQHIHSDEYARIKVRFPWDRSGIEDDKSSTWVRVGQNQLQGPQVLPRVDMEVIVDHELGDRDRPFVTGRVYNEQLKPPYPLPDENIKTTLKTETLGGGVENELRFDDSKGAEEVYVHAGRDQTVVVEHDGTFGVGNEETIDIGKSYEQRVGADNLAVIEGRRKLTVGIAQKVNVEGDYADQVGADHKLTVGAMRKVQSGGDYIESIGGNLIRTIGAVQTIVAMAGYGRHVNGNSHTTVGYCFIEIGGGSFSSAQGGSSKSAVGGTKLIKAKNVTTIASTIIENCITKKVVVGGDAEEKASGNAEVEAQGGMSVKAKNVTYTADEKITVQGGDCTVTMDKSGKVTVKAPTVIVRNADTLSQTTHRSN